MLILENGFHVIQRLERDTDYSVTWNGILETELPDSDSLNRLVKSLKLDWNEWQTSFNFVLHHQSYSTVKSMGY